MEGDKELVSAAKARSIILFKLMLKFLKNLIFFNLLK